jgi:hypothetical protein
MTTKADAIFDTERLTDRVFNGTPVGQRLPDGYWSRWHCHLWLTSHTAGSGHSVNSTSVRRRPVPRGLRRRTFA